MGYMKVFEDYWNYHLKQEIVKILFLIKQIPSAEIFGFCM
jgi:hypothetical protein